MDERPQDPRTNRGAGAAEVAARSASNGRARAKGVGWGELFAMALGLGGLYLLVRIRAEAVPEFATEQEDAAGAAPTIAGENGPPEPPIYPPADSVPVWARDENLWERAKERVRPHWHQYREPWAVVAHVYQQMGGRPV